MTATLDKLTTSGNRGSHYNKGADYVYFVNETQKEIYRQPINPASMIAQQNPKTLSGGSTHNLNGIGVTDLRWSNGALQALSTTKLKLLAGYTALDQIPPDALTGVDWNAIPSGNSVPETGQSAAGNFYAVNILVKEPERHYAKVRVYKEGGVTKIEWITYSASTRPSLLIPLGSNFPAPRALVVTPFETEIFVSGGVGEEGYVLQIRRTAGGGYSTPNQINPGLLDEPQQLILDGAIIYVVAKGGLFYIDLANEIQAQVVGGIAEPVGLLLDKQGAATNAYITDSTGNVYVVDIGQWCPPALDAVGDPEPPLPAPAPSTALALSGPSGYLTWVDDTHTAFYAAVTGATGTVMRVDLVTNSVNREVSESETVVASPWSVEVFDAHSITVVCDAAIVDIDRGFPITAVLMLGIGLIPFELINNSAANLATPGPADGKANTSSVPGYYFSKNGDLSFGGSLSLLINHEGAWNSSLRYYRVTLTNVDTGVVRSINNAFADLRWNPTANPPRFDGVTTGAQSDLFAIRNPADLWYNPYLAAIIHTGLADNGHNRIKVDFFDANKKPVENASFTRLIHVNNTRATATIAPMRRGTDVTAPGPGDIQGVEACGLSAYEKKNDLIAFDLTASHPSGIGNYVLSFHRGGSFLFSLTGSVTATAEQITVTHRNPGEPLRVGHLTGNCDIAGIAVTLHVPSARSINGYGWVDLSASATRGISLAKSPLNHTNWP